jgi:predicted transcriptional regulator
MEVQFTPDIQARLDRLADETGFTTDQFVKDALPGYLDELDKTRQMLDARYDEIKSGRVTLIPGDVAYARLMDSIEARRRKS